MITKSEMTAQIMREIEKITGSKLTLGKLLWAIREGDGLSQAELGRQLNISRQHLCDIEHGRKIVSPKLAADYAEKLGYSREQFIRLSLQDMVDRDGLSVEITLTPKIIYGKKTAAAPDQVEGINRITFNANQNRAAPAH